MNKNLLDVGVKTIFATAIVLLGIGYWQMNRSIVYVDSQQLMNGYKGMQVAKKEFESKVLGWKSNMDTLQKEIELQIKSYEQNKTVLTTSEKKLTEELIKSKQQQLGNYQQVINEKYQQEDQAMSQKVMDRVNDYIKKYGKKKGYNIILAATQYGNIVYSEEHLDVTKEILEGLNADYK